MEKFCVFCGEAPQEKNKEHVLPAWLIEMTGDPGHEAHFGIDFTKEPLKARKFAFDSLVFPACTTCNTRFAELEGRVKPIFELLLSYKPLSSDQLILLLDWLDKVRVGLWLGYLYLDKNWMGIEPNFHIQSRIGQLDRMVSILRVENAGVGLTFAGPHFKSYQLSPTCFGLGVNGLWLVNASGVGLCSQRLGFPYLEPLRFNEAHLLEASPHTGSERIMNPVERIATLPRTVSLYQPVFRAFRERENSEKYLGGDWIKQRTADAANGYGKLFVQKSDSVQIYPDNASTDWAPAELWNKKEVSYRLGEHIFDRIRRNYENSIGLAPTQDERRHLRREGVMARMLDLAMLSNASEVEGNKKSPKRRARRRR
ncbi:MAG: hypothetical protein LAO30_23470 [Acidobacteriia bacterium]|nr:hypothetical protein [Terriglobia bacterium]